MQKTSRNALVYAAFISLCLPLPLHTAAAHARHHRAGHRAIASAGARVIQCVAFAKWDAGIDIAGNARDWWGNAAGIYARGQRPEPGSVLSFRPNARMPLGHVAVVSDVVDARTIRIDQSHWASRGISRDIEVKDVSEDNDWSAVRVQLGRGAGFGSIYPTHGFIYPRADARHGMVEANNSAAPMPALDPAPVDLRLRGRRAAVVEVAEAADTHAPVRGLDLTLPGIGSDAPDRAFK